jgi:hypothetical protein
MKYFLLVVFLLSSCAREIKDNNLKLGTGTANDVVIEANLGNVDNPKLMFDSTDEVWKFSNDGLAFSEVSPPLIIDDLTEKVTPVNDDVLVIEDSADSFSKKKVKISSLPSGGGGGGGSLPHTIDNYLVWSNNSYSYTATTSLERMWQFNVINSGSFSTGALSGMGFSWGVTLGTGTNASGIGSILSYQTNLDQVGKAIFAADVRIPTLSDGTNRFHVAAGFMEVADPKVTSPSAAFYYRDDVNGGRWQLVTRSTSVTEVDSGVTVVGNTVYRLELEYTPGISVVYKIDGVTVGTISTTLPTGFRGPRLVIRKTLGATARTLQNTYIYSRTQGL